MLPQDRRLSKHVIVDASIAYHKTQRTRFHSVTQELRELLHERDELIREVNGFRPLCHPDMLGERVARQVNPVVLEMLTLDEAALSENIQEGNSVEEQACDHKHNNEVDAMLSSTSAQQSDRALLPHVDVLPAMIEDPFDGLTYDEANIPELGNELRNSVDGEIIQSFQTPGGHLGPPGVIGPDPIPTTISPTNSLSTLPQVGYNISGCADGYLREHPTFSGGFP